jgi:hypothetical protein
MAVLIVVVVAVPTVIALVEVVAAKQSHAKQREDIRREGTVPVRRVPR